MDRCDKEFRLAADGLRFTRHEGLENKAIGGNKEIFGLVRIEMRFWDKNRAFNRFSEDALYKLLKGVSEHMVKQAKLFHVLKTDKRF